MGLVAWVIFACVKGSCTNHSHDAETTRGSCGILKRGQEQLGRRHRKEAVADVESSFHTVGLAWHVPILSASHIQCVFFGRDHYRRPGGKGAGQTIRSHSCSSHVCLFIYSVLAPFTFATVSSENRHHLRDVNTSGPPFRAHAPVQHGVHPPHRRREGHFEPVHRWARRLSISRRKRPSLRGYWGWTQTARLQTLARATHIVSRIYRIMNIALAQQLSPSQHEWHLSQRKQ